MVRKHTVAYVTEPEPTPQHSRTGVITIFRISHREIRVKERKEHGMSTAGNTSSAIAPGAMRKFQKVNEILEKYEFDATNLIAILQAIQSEYRYLPREILTFVGTALDRSPSEIFGVATFYSQFSLEPKGKYEIKICDGTACHVRGSIPVLQAIRQKLKLKSGELTTSDMRFSVETVSCLGACGLSPVVMINDIVYPQMTPEKIVKVINKINRLEDDQ